MNKNYPKSHRPDRRRRTGGNQHNRQEPSADFVGRGEPRIGSGHRRGGPPYRGGHRENRTVEETSRRAEVSSVSTENLTMGRNSVRETLLHRPNLIQEILVSDRDSPDLAALREQARGQQIPVTARSDAELESLVGSTSHQGVIARLRSDRATGVKDFLSRSAGVERGIVVVVDSVEDPHNMGAIFRAAECLGALAVVYSKNRGAPVTATARKVSVGATELVPNVVVSNLAQALEEFRTEGWWVVVADGGPESRSVEEVDLPSKVVLVLGSEGHGVQDLIVRRADFRVRIPLRGHIDSLNVSQAAAVLLFALQRGKRS